MKFKQIAAGILAASMLLGGLSACSKTTQSEEELEVVETPAEDETTQTPETPEESQPTDEPEQDEEPVAVEIPEGEAAAVESAETAGDVEELFSYDWSLPQVTVSDADAQAEINAYYDNVATKYNHYATGELFDEAMDGAITGLSADYTVMRNSGNILSVRRELREGADGESVTIYSETFNTENGGLFVASDFFDGDEDTWTAQLIARVTEILEASGQYDTVSLWQDTVRQSFEKDNFYLTDTAYVVYYPAGALGDDPIEVEVPFEELDLFHFPN
jgi:hypothetical protein